jgi:threonine dehydrogenase-like Zn-dependent dehydrogenase
VIGAAARLSGFDPREVDVPARLAWLTAEGVDVEIDCAGNGHAPSDCIRAVRRGGTVMQTALHTWPAELDIRDLTLCDITPRGANCFLGTPSISSGGEPLQQCPPSPRAAL